MNLNPLEQLNLVTMAAMAAIFLVTFVILKALLFKPLIDLMEKRAGKMERSRARYQEAEALIEQARKEAARIATEAAETAERFSEDVRRELAGIRETTRARADAEAEKILDSGRSEVARLKVTEQARLKDQLLTCSKQTLVKIVLSVEDETLRLMVNRVLMDRGAAK